MTRDTQLDIPLHTDPSNPELGVWLQERKMGFADLAFRQMLTPFRMVLNDDSGAN